MLRQAWPAPGPAAPPAAAPQPGPSELRVASRAQDVCETDAEAGADSSELVLFSIP